MADLTEQEGRRLLDELTPLLGDNEEQKDLFESIVRLLSLPDEEFTVLAPMVMQNFQKSLNNPNDKIALAQAANAAGIKSEDLVANFKDLVTQVDESSLPVIKRDFLKELVAAMVNAIGDTEGIAKKLVQVPIQLLSEDVRMPEYAHDTDSGMDVFALEEFTLHPGEKRLIPCGFKVALPPGYELQVRPKSGRALKTQMRIANTPGTIDQGYRDEIGIIVENIDAPIKDILIDEEGHVKSILCGQDVTIGKGEKFAQLILAEVPKVAWLEIENVMEVGEDRGGGFGSTGLK